MMHASEMSLRPLALGVKIISMFVYAQSSSSTQPTVTHDPKELAELCAYSNSSIKYHAYPMEDKVRCYSVRGPVTGGMPVDCPPAASGKGSRLEANTFAVIERKGQLQFIVQNLNAANVVLFIKVNRVREPKELRWTNGYPALNDLADHLKRLDDHLLGTILEGTGLLVYYGRVGGYMPVGVEQADLQGYLLAKTGTVLCSFDVELPAPATTRKDSPPAAPPPGFWQKYGTYIIIGLVALGVVLVVVTLATVLYRRFCRRRRFKRKKTKHGDTTESTTTTTSESTESDN